MTTTPDRSRYILNATSTELVEEGTFIEVAENGTITFFSRADELQGILILYSKDVTAYSIRKAIDELKTH